MATPEEITGAIDGGIANVWPEIVSQQETYLAGHGRYFQGLCTHSTPPADGEPASPDQLNLRPDYQEESWHDVGYDMANPRVALTIDQYRGPHGPGYVCSFRVAINGQIWRRQKNVGPETSRDSDWHVEEVAGD